MNDDQLFIGNRNKQEELVKSFVKKLSEDPDADLSGIITKYIGYQPETVRAALIVSVDKGLISYDLKELLWKQIEANFEAHNKHIKQYKWESNNAFIKYVSGYQDEEIYSIIEDPHDIVLDVYNAILLTAKERELITGEDFNTYYENAKSSAKSDFEIRNEEIDELFGIGDSAELFENEADLEAEKEKFWKCPKCNQLVGMEFGVCWNCETEIPEIVEHPGTAEIIKERTAGKTFKPVKTGLLLIVAGLLIAWLDPWRNHFHLHSLSNHWRLGGYIFGGFFALIGIVFVVYGLFFNTVKQTAESKAER